MTMTYYTPSRYCRIREDWEGSHGSQVRRNISFSHFPLIDHGNSGLSAGIKWRPEPSELPEFGSEFKELWDAHFANAPDKPVLWMGVVSAYVFILALPVNLYHYTLRCI
jgi:hypothetical protein